MQTIDQVTFVLGHRCNSGCSHCIVNATPDSSMSMDRDLALNHAVDVVNLENQIKKIHFSGGEPFLYLDLMVEITEVLNSKDVKQIVVSTGAAEFTSFDKTKEMLSRLKSINQIWVSIDNYHLENVSIENYRIFDKVVRDFNIDVGYSICFQDIKEFAQILLLIEREGFRYQRIIKQPILGYGRALSLLNNPKCESMTIPEDYRCAETTLAYIWPDGYITNCGAYAGRADFLPRSRNFQDFFRDNENDTYYHARCKYSLKEIAEKNEIKGPFDISSTCFTCKSMLHQGLSLTAKK